jgi:TP901 family phage tail tape measure protein
VMMAASASGEDLGRTADVLTDIMAAFNLEAEDSVMIADALARAAGASSADMSSLGDGFANVGGIAKEFGLSVEDTAAILAVFAENGIKGSDAGTLLRSMLTNMSRQTDKSKEAWKKAGVSMYDAMGKMRPLATVMKELSAAMAGMDDETRNSVMHDIAGSFGELGLVALTSSMSIDEMKKRMGESAGTADIAKAKMGTFAASMDALKGSVETLMITAFTPFMNDVLKPMAGEITNVVNKIGEWAAANPQIVKDILSVVGIAAIAGGGLMILGQAVNLLTTGFNLLVGAVKLLFSPLGLIAAGVTFVGWAWTTNWMGIQDTTEKVVFLVVNLLNDVTKSAQQLAILGTVALVDFANAGIGAFEALGNAIGGFFVDRLVTAMQAYAIVANAIGDTENARIMAESIAGLTAPSVQVDRIAYPEFVTKGFSSGGYTGSGTGAAGIVHGEEFVVPKRGALVLGGGGAGKNVTVNIGSLGENVTKGELMRVIDTLTAVMG